ncbi:hypothetical protein GCM10007860_05130 [Chitiniphilus shinanonensis]|uniref:Cobalt transport protein n=1 Tax=Chitiniphilus shinanonensis TaxID=553088 RepID=A0ABQ6BMZ2_9NEIS|nr:hypothetical protein [Chitiniphilus shinanonensis]GLS03370.1 hypothetical protein GCM10007860_05130 [Chitiniphilus shinanonensis]
MNTGHAWAHPAQRMLCWFWVACGVQWMQPTPLCFGVAMAALWLLWRTPRRLWQLLRRMRMLLLAIVLVYGWSVPGQYLWPHPWSPTHEGLEAGATQGLRLLGVVLTLQWMLGGLSRERLFDGMYVLAAPLAWLGLDRRRAALRLALTLAYADRLLGERPGWRSVWQALADGREWDVEAPVALQWPPSALGARQRAVLLLVLLGVIATLLCLLSPFPS